MLVVNPNVCFDRTMRIDRLTPGTVMRPSDIAVTAGGKGVNVARTARDLGLDATLVAMLARTDGDRLRALLDAEHIVIRPVPVDGAVRCATIVLEDDRRATVLNEPGPLVGLDDLERLADAVTDLLRTEDAALVCSGSLPPGLPASTYGRLATLARQQGVVSIVDAARDVLAATLEHEPDLVTPNLAEAEGLISGVVTEPVDTHARDRAEIIERSQEAATQLLARGARRALVSVGEYGACLVDERRSTWIDAPVVRVVNPIGAGDSLVGGIAVALAHGQEWEPAARYGVSVASASVELGGAGSVDSRRVLELHGQNSPVPS